MSKFRSIAQNTAVATLVSAMLASCSLAPAYYRPVAPVPQSWEGAGVKVERNPDSIDLEVMQWDAFVLDPQLRAIIDLALENNRDVRKAVLSVEAARAQYGIQRADQMPNVGVEGAGTRQRQSDSLRSDGMEAVASNYQAGVALSAFELDLFGRVRNLSEAALREYLATAQVARSVRLRLITDVSTAYIQYRSAQTRQALVQQTLETRQRSMVLIQLRQQQGIDSALDFADAQGLMSEAEVQLHRVERELAQSGNALRLLAGKHDLDIGGPRESELAFFADVQTGLPSSMIERRPDIIAAEQRLLARNADIGAARAAFFPSITLTGLLGSASDELSGLFDTGTRAWSFTPRLNLPIFSGGRNRAALDLAATRKEIAVADYEQSIQQGFSEVADGLASLDTLAEERAAQERVASASGAALSLAEVRYRAGVDSNLRYMDAQRRSFADQLLLVDVRMQRQVALATLYNALGGSWHAEPHGYVVGPSQKK